MLQARMMEQEFLEELVERELSEQDKGSIGMIKE